MARVFFSVTFGVQPDGYVTKQKTVQQFKEINIIIIKYCKQQKLTPMAKTIYVLMLIACMMFTACQNKPKPDVAQAAPQISAPQTQATMTDVSYVVAENYFVKNNVTQLDNPKIETAEKFNEIFGMATTMGKDGKPTAIDFSKQYVIALVLPETDMLATIRPVGLQKNDKKEITLDYRVEVGPKQTYTIRPSIAIIVDKAEDGNITLKEIE
jgi:hypothetical protein